MVLTLHRSKVGSEPLCDLALEDIASKLSEENIVEEFFSCITVR